MGVQLGGSFRYLSGRPKSAFGIHPTDEFAQEYGAESFFANGQGVPRGSLGTTDDLTILDLSAQYPLELGKGTLNFRVDVFNALDGDSVTEVFEEFDQESGSVNPNFGLPTHHQKPRRVRFSASFRF